MAYKKSVIDAAKHLYMLEGKTLKQISFQSLV